MWHDVFCLGNLLPAFSSDNNDNASPTGAEAGERPDRALVASDRIFVGGVGDAANPQAAFNDFPDPLADVVYFWEMEGGRLFQRGLHPGGLI